MNNYAMWIVMALLAGFMLYNRFAGKTSSADAHQLVASGALLLDVRSPAEFAGGHIDGARNIPVDQLAGRLAEVGPKDKAVVVYCRSGARSSSATQVLRSAGYTQVYDLGPMSAW